MQILTLPARRLAFSDEEWAVALLAEAYAVGPRPAAAARQHAQLQLLVRYALRAGSVYAGPDDHSVAVWLPAEAEALSWGSLLRTGQITLPLHLGWSTFWDLMRQQQRHDTLRRRVLPMPHHNLLALGVRPAQQQQGAGRALLRASLAAVGARFLPCYVEVHTPKVLPLAQQLGFEIIGTEERMAFGTNQPCWGLVRPAGAV